MTYQTRWRIWIGQTWGWRGRLNIIEISRTWTTICRIELVGLAWWPRSWPVCFSISVFRFWKKKIKIIIIFLKSDLTVFGSSLALDTFFVFVIISDFYKAMIKYFCQTVSQSRLLIYSFISVISRIFPFFFYIFFILFTCQQRCKFFNVVFIRLQRNFWKVVKWNVRFWSTNS